MMEMSESYRYRETGFRALYEEFAIFPLKEELRFSIEGFPGADEADCILVYGYIDHEVGLTLEVLAAGRRKRSGASFFEGSDTIRSFIRIDVVMEDEFHHIEDEDGMLRQRYANKLDGLVDYEVSEDVEKSREMLFLDPLRHEECIDDVLVHLVKEGAAPEACWARIVGLGERCFGGMLLNEPDQDLGVHMGDEIVFFAQRMEDGKPICWSDLDLEW
ncbi:MAG: hypothetical protein IJR14_00900 [Synergistaceae bacterium]|nr:hypothetical protein [Synergistaceae bacterium]